MVYCDTFCFGRIGQAKSFKFYCLPTKKRPDVFRCVKTSIVRSVENALTSRTKRKKEQNACVVGIDSAFVSVKQHNM